MIYGMPLATTRVHYSDDISAFTFVAARLQLSMSTRNIFEMAVLLLLLLSPSSYGQNQVMGEVHFTGAGKVENSSGVWVDGQYVGYVKELKGSKKVLLLPGQHQIAVRQAGYLDFTDTIVVEPGQVQNVNIKLEKDPHAVYSGVTGEIKLKVTPDRAAVFVDDAFAGYVHEFGGVKRAMLVAPGKHHIKIALPGYKAFDTDIDLLPNQKVTIKTDLVPGSITDAGSPIKKED
jgi:PEGA domain